MVRSLGIQLKQKRPEKRAVKTHFPMQNVLKICPEDFLDIRRAHDFTRGVEALSQRHCDQFGISVFRSSSSASCRQDRAR